MSDETVIYGRNAVLEALRSGREIEKIYVEKPPYTGSMIPIINLAKKRRILLSECDHRKLSELSGGGVHQGVVASCAAVSYVEVEDILKRAEDKGEAPFLVVCESIQDPHNLGAILRSVDAFGFDMVILPKNRSVLVTEVAAHVSTGAIEYTKIVYVNSLNQAITTLKENCFWICGTDAMGTIRSSEIDPSLSLAVIIGSEGFGMSKTLVKQSDYLITIPMVGHVNSLNASVSAGIVLHDLCLKK